MSTNANPTSTSTSTAGITRMRVLLAFLPTRRRRRRRQREDDEVDEKPLLVRGGRGERDCERSRRSTRVREERAGSSPEGRPGSSRQEHAGPSRQDANDNANPNPNPFDDQFAVKPDVGFIYQPTKPNSAASPTLAKPCSPTVRSLPSATPCHPMVRSPPVLLYQAPQEQHALTLQTQHTPAPQKQHTPALQKQHTLAPQKQHTNNRPPRICTSSAGDCSSSSSMPLPWRRRLRRPFTAPAVREREHHEEQQQARTNGTVHHQRPPPSPLFDLDEFLGVRTVHGRESTG